MHQRQNNRERIVKISEKRKEFVTDVDGYVYWWPEGSNNGHLSSEDLRCLANELDDRNKKMDEELEDFFKKEQEKRRNGTSRSQRLGNKGWWE
jgi:hypothetical protein